MQKLTTLTVDQKRALAAMLWWLPILSCLAVAFLIFSVIHRGTYFPFVDVPLRVLLADVGAMLIVGLLFYIRQIASKTVVDISFSNDELLCRLMNGKVALLRGQVSRLLESSSKPLFNFSPLNPSDRVLGIHSSNCDTIYLPLKSVSFLVSLTEQRGAQSG